MDDAYPVHFNFFIIFHNLPCTIFTVVPHFYLHWRFPLDCNQTAVCPCTLFRVRCRPHSEGCPSRVVEVWGKEVANYKLTHLSATLLQKNVDKDKVYQRKGNRTIAELRYGGKYIISPSTQIFAPKKGQVGILTLHIPLEVL